MKILKILFSFFYFFVACVTITRSQGIDTTVYKVIAAGPQYERNSLHQFLWGRHYRNEWKTPAAVKFFYLDTATGGLTPYAAGGGRKTKSLRLTNPQGKEYVLRSVDKSFGKALPPIFQNTFVERILNDEVSIAHPYAALTVAPMAEAAGIYHTWPQIVYVPQQKKLDSFNAAFGNDLYLFEQRADENWVEAANFGNTQKIINTQKVLDNLMVSNTYTVDQPAYIKARLFDMFAGDWGRHEDQWKWASYKNGDTTVYRAIPGDRDQTYARFDGLLVKLLKSAAGGGHLQTFDASIKNIETYNFPARYLDRVMANKMTLQDWLTSAQQLQKLLTDSVIENAVKKMPEEVFPVSGQGIITKLKSRRDALLKYATAYYNFLAKEVEIKGSNEPEIFEVTAFDKNNLTVQVFAAQPATASKGRLIYSRNFSASETKEIRMYGINGHDTYTINNNSSPIKIRLIGGPADDSFTVQGKGVHIYDSKEQPLTNVQAKRHLSNDTAIHAYKYDAFTYSDKGLSPSVMFNREDRIYVGLSYKILNNKWRREPFANKHNFYARYSINQRAFRVGYDGIVNKLAGNWNLLLQADYDWERWTNFFGLGNETVRVVRDRNFYRVRSKAAHASVGFENIISKKMSLIISPFYNSIDIKTDEERFLMKNFLLGRNKEVLDNKQFGGAQLALQFNHVNNNLWPTKGFSLNATTSYTANLKERKSFNYYGGMVHLYFPLTKKLVFNTQNGAATVTGNPEFYQFPNIGGRTLKGYTRERFWGETVFHNNNSLQYIFNVKGKLFNGKAGLEAFYDQGRVWIRNEQSNKWHTGYGGGVVLSPFNKFYLAILYGISNEKTLRGNVNVEVRRSL